MRFALTFLAITLVSATGCKPPPQGETTKAFQREVHIYFNNLNQEAQTRKEELRSGLAKAATNPAMAAPTGTILNTYYFDEGAFLVENFKWEGGVEKMFLAIPDEGKIVALSLRVDGKLPKSAAAVASKEGFGRTKDLYEPTQATPGKPFRAKVRYVRRQWSFDARASVLISDKAVEKASSSRTWLPMQPTAEMQAGKYDKPGFHRLDGVFVGEIEFEFRGGTLTAIGVPVEDSIRPWSDLKKNT